MGESLCTEKIIVVNDGERISYHYFVLTDKGWAKQNCPETYIASYNYKALKSRFENNSQRSICSSKNLGRNRICITYIGR